MSATHHVKILTQKGVETIQIQPVTNLDRLIASRFELIGMAIGDLNEYGFMTERTLEKLRERKIDPVQVELGWADVGDLD